MCTCKLHIYPIFHPALGVSGSALEFSVFDYLLPITNATNRHDKVPFSSSEGFPFLLTPPHYVSLPLLGDRFALFSILDTTLRFPHCTISRSIHTKFESFAWTARTGLPGLQSQESQESLERPWEGLSSCPDFCPSSVPTPRETQNSLGV